jgi:hypothetical protein
MGKTAIINRKSGYFLFSVIIAALLLLAISNVARAQEDSIRLVGSSEGKLRVTTEAVGLIDGGSPTITIDVPGTPMTATITWSGRGPVGDDTITLDINGTGAKSITANFAEQAFANCCASDNYVYVAQLPASAFSTGVNTVQVSGLTIAESHGATLVISSFSDAFQKRLISRYWGLDSYHSRWEGVYGPYSEVVCQQFDAENFDRDLNFLMTIGGVENDLRPNSIWYQVGFGSLPTGDIVNVGTEIATSNDGSGHPFPTYSTQNQNTVGEYDLFKQDGILIPTGSSWICFQHESYDTAELLGVSALWHGLVTDLELPPDTPTTITLSSVSASGSGAYGTVLFLLVAAIVGMTGLTLLFKRRVVRN